MSERSQVSFGRIVRDGVGLLLDGVRAEQDRGGIGIGSLTSPSGMNFDRTNRTQGSLSPAELANMQRQVRTAPADLLTTLLTEAGLSAEAKSFLNNWARTGVAPTDSARNQLLASVGVDNKNSTDAARREIMQKLNGLNPQAAALGMTALMQSDPMASQNIGQTFYNNYRYFAGASGPFSTVPGLTGTGGGVGGFFANLGLRGLDLMIGGAAARRPPLVLARNANTEQGEGC